MKLTDTQLLLLSTASQRDDNALEPLSNLAGAAAHRVVAKLLSEGLVEESSAGGTLPVWSRDDDGPRCLRITKKGLAAIGVEEEPAKSGEPIEAPAAQLGKRTRPGKPPSGGQTKIDLDPRVPVRARAELQAGQRDFTAQQPTGDDDRGDHDGHGLAAALGAWLLCRRGAQKAWFDAGVGKDRD